MEQEAALIRLFYSQADSSDPNVSMTYPTSEDVGNPTIHDSLSAFNLTASASDAESGILKQGYQCKWSYWNGSSWSSWYDVSPSPTGASVSFTPTNGETLYRFYVVAENGGGHRADTRNNPKYMRIILPPEWTAYNDHNRGAGTAVNVSTYSLGMNGTAGVPTGGPLTNFATGQLTGPYQVGIAITSAGMINGVAGDSQPPDPGSPAEQIFGWKVDWTVSALPFGGSGQAAVSEVRITFTNVNPRAQYSFWGTGVRGTNYATRWTLATLAGASSARATHWAGLGSPGIVTNGWSPFGDTLTPMTPDLLT